MIDPETLERFAIEEEGEFLFRAARQASRFADQLEHRDGPPITTAELVQMAYAFRRAVTIASEYHVGALDCGR